MSKTSKTDNERRVNVRVRISTRARLKIRAARERTDMVELVDKLSRQRKIPVKGLVS